MPAGYIEETAGIGGAAPAADYKVGQLKTKTPELKPQSPEAKDEDPRAKDEGPTARSWLP